MQSSYKSIGTLVFATIAAIPYNADAGPRAHYSSANVCRHVVQGAESVLEYGNTGIRNNDTNAQTVVCPLSWSGTQSDLTGAFVYIWYRDRSSSSSIGSISCSLFGIEKAANTITLDTKHSCSSLFGCTTAAPTYLSPTATVTLLGLNQPLTPTFTKLIARCTLSPGSTLIELMLYTPTDNGV